MSSGAIDLHAHILPGLDDGSPSLAVTLDMARVAVADGITTIVATPHAGDWTYPWDSDARESALATVRGAIEDAGLQLRVIGGAEIMIEPGLAQRVGTGQHRCIDGTHYVLVELPFRHFPNYVESTIFELQLAGYRPILAHAERYAAVQDDPNVVAPLVERGVVVQITAGSVTGDFGARARETAEILTRHGLAHLIASDAHDAARRPPVVSAARALIAEWLGDDVADRMARGLPELVLADRPVPVPSPQPYRRKRRWPLWRFGIA